MANGDFVGVQAADVIDNEGGLIVVKAGVPGPFVLPNDLLSGCEVQSVWFNSLSTPATRRALRFPNSESEFSATLAADETDSTIFIVTVDGSDIVVDAESFISSYLSPPTPWATTAQPPPTVDQAKKVMVVMAESI